MRAAGELREQGYVDRVMDPSTLPPPGADGEDAPVDGGGFRAWSVESRVGAAKSGGLLLRSATELGQSFRYQHQTVSHGAFQVEADWRHGPDTPGFSVGSISAANKRNSARLTVRNFAFPLTPRTFVDSAVGDIYSEVTRAFTRTYRLSLGTSVLRGASSRVAGSDFEVRAGTGLRGTLAGSPYPGFERTRGQLSWAGASIKLSDRIGAGLQVNHATDVPAFGTFLPLSSANEDVTSVAAAVSYTAPADAPLQHGGRAIYVRSHAGLAPFGGERDAQGLFLEGNFVTGTLRHDVGAYAADANLRFGDYALAAADNHGAYWRVDSSSSRASWFAGADYDAQDSDPAAGAVEARRIGFSGGGQYRFSRTDAVGGHAQLAFARYGDTGAAVPGTSDTTRSINANAFYQTRIADWAPTRLRVSVYRNERLVANDVAATGEELAWEQEWLQGRDDDLQRPEFITTLGVSRDRSAGQAETTPMGGATFRLWPQPDWFVGGTLRYTARDSNLYTARGLSGTFTTEKQLAQGWRVGAAVSLNQAVVRVPVVGLAEPEVVRSNDRSASVYLRWEDAAGSTPDGVGVREPGTAGAGSVGGIVFLDADQDGRQSLDEVGASGVEVILDGRFRVVTDRFGRFDFPLVTTGRHQLSLTPETVPLPWGVPRAQDVRVEVPLRGQAFVRIPVVRTGD